MASCKCGATVTFVQVDGERFPLENFEANTGVRYQIVDFSSDPWTAVAIDQNSPESAYLDHRTSCPFRP